MSSSRTFSGGRSGAGGGTGSASVVVTPNTGLSGNGTSVNPLAGVPASALVPGTMSVADFVKLATVPAGMGIPWYAVSAEIDFSALGNTAWGANWPIVPGYMFVPFNGRLVVTALAGAHVANAACSVGTNGAAFNNIIPNSAFSAAVLNVAVGNGVTKNWAISMSAAMNTLFAFPEMTVAPTVIVGTACTVGTVLKGKIDVVGTLMPFVP